MKIISLKTNPQLYSGNSYMLLGEWNTLSDVNAVIDTGSDNYIVKDIEETYTGVGKNPVDKVILTHNHFDHIGGAMALKKKYNSKIYSFIKTVGLTDLTLQDGEIIKLADKEFTIIHTPGHSADSICIYNEEEQILFTGDTTIQVRDILGSYTPDYLETLNKLSRLKIKTIYPGHGKPITENPEDIIKYTIKNVHRSIIVY
ncbi:MAG: MBL fold metallo-hydrolase [Ignavibacteria bacterium]|nr:MBL fold metallo-hydrolase [Ignavibacteria bacterium]